MSQRAQGSWSVLLECWEAGSQAVDAHPSTFTLTLRPPQVAILRVQVHRERGDKNGYNHVIPDQKWCYMRCDLVKIHQNQKSGKYYFLAGSPSLGNSLHCLEEELCMFRWIPKLRELSGMRLRKIFKLQNLSGLRGGYESMHAWLDP